MSFPPNSRRLMHQDPQTTAKPEVASYQEMGDLLPHRRPPRILVVDDQPTIAALMSQLLGMRGYDVVTAANAEQAEAEGDRQGPRLNLSDVFMPRKSGCEIFREFKDKPATRLVPLLLITGLSGRGEKVRGVSVRADDLL